MQHGLAAIYFLSSLSHPKSRQLRQDFPIMTNNIPSHVPPNLIRDFDFVDMRGETDVYEHFRKLHDGPDFFFTPHHGGHWVATRFADMEAILGNPAAFSSKHQTVPPMPIRLTLIEWDGQMHADARAVLAPYFSPKAVGGLEDTARTLTTSLIDGFIDKGECEFVQDFAFKMPITIMMRLMDLPPEDTPYLLQISEDIVRSVDPIVQQAAFQRVAEYVANQVIPSRRANPGSDLFSAILGAKIDNGRHFTDPEIISFGSVLFAAGLDTVSSTMGFIAKFLAENPSHRRDLVSSPELIASALEEFQRRFSLANIARVVVDDMEFKGIQLSKDDRILIPTSAAGIDNQRFPDPMEVDYARKDKKTLLFGRGPHMCAGNFLARTEMRVFLQEWLSRIPEFGIKPGETPIVAPGKANCVRYLPLVWPTT
jgi:cytochrome P450